MSEEARPTRKSGMYVLTQEGWKPAKCIEYAHQPRPYVQNRSYGCLTCGKRTNFTERKRDDE